MLIVVADAVVTAANRARLNEVAAAMITASRAEEGCQGYAYSWDLLEPDRLRVIELWTDEAALRFHFKTAHMAAFQKALADMGAGPNIIVYKGGEPHAIQTYAR